MQASMKILQWKTVLSWMIREVLKPMRPDIQLYFYVHACLLDVAEERLLMVGYKNGRVTK